MKIARLVGGAGTGKTTELLAIMEAALEQIKDPTLLGFASFTRAARAEAVSRASTSWGIDPAVLSKRGWFRTVHSTVLRCLGDAAGSIVSETKQDLEWLSSALGVSLATQIDDSYGQTRFIGDPVTAAALSSWALARSSLTPLEIVIKRMRIVDDNIPDYAKVVQIVDRYELAKRLDDRMDFDDMLMRFAGIRLSPQDADVQWCQPLGEMPEVVAWLFDEQQDASPLLDAVCKRLVSAPSVKWTYVVGDPFQSIYGFAGSSSKCFMAWDAEKERVMPKSWRCPKVILDLGERCLRRMQNGSYFDRKIAPADHAGTVADVSSIDDLVQAVNPNDDWLLVARTNYQATRLAAAMHSSNKPFRWTSQPTGITQASTGMRCLHDLEQGKHVTGEQWQAAMTLLPQRDKDKKVFLVRGTKTKWAVAEVAKQWDVIWPDELEKVGATQDLIECIKSSRWTSLVNGGQQWRDTAKRWGTDLACFPKVRVGTIHSVKGAEADNVGILTTTSQTIERGMTDREQANEECRIAYVGVTRTRKNLHIINEGRSGTPRMEIL